MAKADSTASNITNNQHDLAGENFEPVFTLEQVNEFERNYNESWGVSRRCAMITLVRSKKELIDGWKSLNDNDAILLLINQLIDYRKHLEIGIEITNTALARLLIVGENVKDNSINH